MTLIIYTEKKLLAFLLNLDNPVDKSSPADESQQIDKLDFFC